MNLFLKVSILIVFVLVVLQLFSFVNLMVSDKYETDTTIIELSDLSKEEKEIELNKIKLRSEEIQSQKRTSKTWITALMILFFILGLSLAYRIKYKD